MALRGLRQTNLRKFPWLGLVLLCLAGCSAPGFDITTEAGRRAIINEVDRLITAGRCDAAVDLIEPLYASSYSNNEIRFSRASAHGCRSGIDYWDLVSEILDNASTLTVGGGLWAFLAEYFYNSTATNLNNQMHSSWFATDAVQAILRPGVILPTDLKINASTNNVGSLWPQHHTDEANFYLIFVSMAAIGATQDVYGNPSTTTWTKGNDLPWITTDLMTTDGCAYASGIVNMLDGINEASSFTNSTFSSSLTSIYTAFSTAINDACDLGCQGLDPLGAATGDANCTYAAGECTPCVEKLRNRDNCAADTQTNCAATGIVRYINSDPLGNGWQ